MIARSAISCNTNVIGGSGVFRELVVIAQGRAGPWGAGDDALSRALAKVLVVFKSNACGSAKQVLRTDVLGDDHAEDGRYRKHWPKTPKKKKAKTAEASARVVQVAEKQSADALKQHYSKRQLKAVRKVYWFEKFNWFITSENFLVLAGR